MSTKSFYKVDPKLESDGAWYTAVDGSRWQLRRIGVGKSAKAFDDAQKPYAGMIQQATLRGERIPREVDQEITRKTLINGVIVSFEGVTDEDADGNEIVITRDLLDGFFAECPDLANELWAAAGRMDRYKAILRQEAAKNSVAG